MHIYLFTLSNTTFLPALVPTFSDLNVVLAVHLALGLRSGFKEGSVNRKPVPARGRDLVFFMYSICMCSYN